jgi:hypothetical protein
MTGSLLSNESESVRRGAIVPNLRYWPDIYFEGLRKPRKPQGIVEIRTGHMYNAK